MPVASFLQRVVWCAAALASLLLLSGLFFIEHVPGWLPIACLAVALMTSVRPLWGLGFAAATIPIAGYTMRLAWNSAVPWAEVDAVAVIAGWAARRSMKSGPAVAPTIAVPLLLLGAIVSSSIVATTAADGVTLGAGFGSSLWEHVTRSYWIFPREFPGLHAGLQVLEGLVLCAAVTALAATRPQSVRLVSAAIVGGAAIAGVIDVLTFARRATAVGSFWTTLTSRLVHLRYNVHYGDLNAAGSYFVMTIVAAIALARTAGGARRVLAIAAAVCAIAGLWLSGSRVAMLAGVVAVAGSLLLRRTRHGGRALIAGAATIAAAALVIGAIWTYMPLRGNQKASDIAVSVRAGMAAAALGMIRAHPLLGIGVGEFTTRAGEFASPDVLAIFPAAHENAHNDLLQMGAELGIPGLLLFVALLAGAAWAGRPAPDDPLRWGLITALVAFLLTGVGGHPLLTREVSYTFWLLLGCVAGGASSPPLRRPVAAAAAAAIALIAITTPLRITTLLADTNFDHAGVGVSQWQTSPDGIRYREADDSASVFVPAAGPVGLRVQALLDRRTKLKAILDGRTINVIDLAPGRWTDLAIPPRDRQPRARYSRLDLQLIDAPPHTKFWITKDHPFQ